MNQMNQANHMNQKTVLVAVSDIFFYTKIRDALLPKGYVLERARTQDDVPAKAESLHPCAMILNMNDPAVRQASADKLMPMQKKTSPLAMRGKNEFRSSSLP